MDASSSAFLYSTIRAKMSGTRLFMLLDVPSYHDGRGVLLCAKANGRHGATNYSQRDGRERAEAPLGLVLANG